MYSGFRTTPLTRESFKFKVKRKAEELLGKADHSRREIPPNDVDAKYLRQNLEIYYEFPPIFKEGRTRRNDPWDNANYTTPEPLLDIAEKEFQQIYKNESVYYTWMCYAKLK